MDFYLNGVVTSGSYFTYKGVHYGVYTDVLFTEEFYKRVGEWVDPQKTSSMIIRGGWKYPYFRRLSSITTENGKTMWNFCTQNIPLVTHHYVDVNPNRDIEKIITPVYYMEPKELVKKRLHDGTWINYILPQTLFFLFCLLVSPLLKEWYIIWTLGTYTYLRTSYITLSKGELNRGW